MKDLQEEMNQIERDGRAEIAAINLAKEASLQKLEEEKSRRLRNIGESERIQYNAEVRKFNKDVEEIQTKLKAEHVAKMNAINNVNKNI